MHINNHVHINNPVQIGQIQEEEETPSSPILNEVSPLLTPNNQQQESLITRVGRICAICSCVIAFHVNLSGFTVFETIGTPLTEQYYGWHVMENGLLYLGCALCSIVGFVLLTLIIKWTGERFVLATSPFVMGSGYILISFVPLPLYRFLLSAAGIALA